MSCFTEVDETKNFYAFRVRSPALFIKDSFRTPRWARNVAESVVPGAYVTLGVLSKTGKWATQSIKVPLAGRTTRDARQLAMRIAAKLKACPEATAMNREKACGCQAREKGEELWGKRPVEPAWEERSEASKEFERKKMLERFEHDASYTR